MNIIYGRSDTDRTRRTESVRWLPPFTAGTAMDVLDETGGQQQQQEERK